MEDLGKLFVANGLKKLPKVKKIAQSGHTGSDGGNEQLQLGDTLPIWVNVDVTGCGSTVNYNNKTMAGTNDCLLRC